MIVRGRNWKDPHKALNISTYIATGLVVVASVLLAIFFLGEYKYMFSVIVGLAAGIGVGFVAELYTDDEILLIKSQRYSAFSDAKQSIETLKKNIEGNNFTVAVNKNGEFYFKLFSPSGRLICCGEPCKTRDDCKLAIEAVKRIAFKAEVVRG